jgi:hypothetical protein
MDLDHLKKLVDACHEEAEQTNNTVVAGAELDAYLLTVEPAKSLAAECDRLNVFVARVSLASTDLDLEHLCALSAAATPGPWKAVQLPARGIGPWRVDAPDIDCIIGDVGEVGTDPCDAGNAEFIAAARTAVPVLLDEVARLRGSDQTIAERDALHARATLLAQHVRQLLEVVRRNNGWLPHEDQQTLFAAKAVLEQEPLP